MKNHILTCPKPRRASAARLAAALALGLTAGPLQAQELAQNSGDDRPYFDDERLSREAEEAIRDFLELVEPVLRQFEGVIRDLPAYEPPEILPNGDIIIRRKRGWGGQDAPADGEGGTKT